MVVGDENRFAVEYGLDTESGGDWLYGTVCFWIGGVRVGNVNARTSLRDFLFSVERLRCDRGRRDNPRFANMTAQQIFELLDGTLFGAGNPTYDEIANDEQWARHLLKPDVDPFNQWKIYLIETTETVRLIYRSGTEGPVHESALRPGECDNVLDEVCTKIGALRRTM